MGTKNKDKATFGGIRDSLGFMSRMGYNPAKIFLPVMLSTLSAFFEGIAVALLLPLARAAIYRDFDYARGIPGFSYIISLLPPETGNADTYVFFLILSAILLSMIAKNLFQYWGYVSVMCQTEQFSDNLRRSIFRRYLSCSKLFFDRTSNAHLSTVLSGFTQSISLQLQSMNNLLRGIIMISVYVGIMLFISWPLTLLVLLVALILNYCLKKIRETVKELSKDKTFNIINMNKKALDVFMCMPIVEANNRKDAEAAEFEKLSDSVRKNTIKMNKKFALVGPLHEMITTLATLFIVVVVSIVVVRMDLRDVSKFLLFFVIMRRAAGIAGTVENFKMSLAGIKEPIRQIKRVFEDDDKIFVEGGDREFHGLKHSIELKNVNFSYIGGVKILDGVSLTIPRGKVTAIVGPTGSGKTTLISLLLRFYDCPPNTIFIDGVDIKEYSLVSLRGNMTLVSQDIMLFNDTVRNNISYGTKGIVSEERLADAARRAGVYDFIKTLPKGFDTEIGDRGVRLSGGEKQRLSIARVLLKEAEILILDEATSALDSKTEKLIQNAIDEAVSHRTAIVIAHRLSTIKHADNIVVIEQGRVVEHGGLDHLIEKEGKFYGYWKEQRFF